MIMNSTTQAEYTVRVNPEMSKNCHKWNNKCADEKTMNEEKCKKDSAQKSPAPLSKDGLTTAKHYLWMNNKMMTDTENKTQNWEMD